MYGGHFAPVLPPFIPFPRPSEKRSYSRRIGRGTSSNQTYAALTGRESFEFERPAFCLQPSAAITNPFSREDYLNPGPLMCDAREQGLVVSASPVNLSDRACFDHCLLASAAPARSPPPRSSKASGGEDCGPQGTAIVWCCSTVVVAGWLRGGLGPCGGTRLGKV